MRVGLYGSRIKICKERKSRCLAAPSSSDPSRGSTAGPRSRRRLELAVRLRRRIAACRVNEKMVGGFVREVNAKCRLIPLRHGLKASVYDSDVRLVPPGGFERGHHHHGY